jgi:hypothetical protein
MSRFLYTRPSDRITAGTWSFVAGTARSSYPLTNLDDGDPSNPFWANETTVRIVKDFGTPTRVDEVYIFAHTFDAALNVRVQMHTSSSWGSPAVDVPLTIPTARLDGRSYHLRADVASAYSVTGRTKQFLSVANLSANSVTVAIGEIYIVGVTRSLGRNVRFGFSIPRNRMISRQPSKLGVSTIYDRGTVEQRLLATIPATEADFTDLQLLEEDGKSGVSPFVVVLAPGSITNRWAEPLLVRQAEPISAAPFDHPSLISVPFSLDVLGCGEVVAA